MYFAFSCAAAGMGILQAIAVRGPFLWFQRF